MIFFVTNDRKRGENNPEGCSNIFDIVRRGGWNRRERERNVILIEPYREEKTLFALSKIIMSQNYDTSSKDISNIYPWV
jgi:hypothetical protein